MSSNCNIEKDKSAIHNSTLMGIGEISYIREHLFLSHTNQINSLKLIIKTTH
ncbi:UNKNOWN [Stylonychia lemnae]|uniref:Uncharacterized protein n=1 Tax=Stylonychia lemnae TaxID=5949 RepID=A0A078BAG7_STYLE|nr:UNKNOWN [Stylonychia lemnae]|eukprot:CDW90543.1 UNKNOWN [Stylonychia lemnae]